MSYLPARGKAPRLAHIIPFPRCACGRAAIGVDTLRGECLCFDHFVDWLGYAVEIERR